MSPDHARQAQRADELLPEEKAAGSDDPQRQAEAILDDSDERQADRDRGGEQVERRTSGDTVSPVDRD